MRSRSTSHSPALPRSASGYRASKAGGARRPTTAWRRIQRELRASTSGESYRNWVEPVRTGFIDDDRSLRLTVPSTAIRDWLATEFEGRILAAARKLGVEVRGVEYEVAEAAPVPVQQTFDFTPPRHPFNARYTFRRFVVGASNEFAHAAAKAVAVSPSEAYNPLYLYAGTGLGKTHLLHAIGHWMQRRHPDLRVIYVTAEEFLNDMIKSIRTNSMRGFHERFRSADALLVDDIQMIASKERTQEEFFHTFNSLHTGGKQIVLASDSSPSEIPGIVDRLKSRFAWGLMADIQRPDLETKMAILDCKAEERGAQLPEEVRTYIAARLTSNIRELEEFVNQLTARVRFLGGKISLEMVRHLFELSPRQAEPVLTVDVIQRAVAEEFDLKVSDLIARSNAAKFAYPRQIAMYLCKHETKASLSQIGREFKRHHTTVMHSIGKIEKKRSGDQELNSILASLGDRITIKSQ